MNENNIDTENKKVESQVFVLRMSYLFIVNYSYLVVDQITRQAVVVDPAWDMGSIDQALLNTQTSLRGILLTHSHPDHVHLAIPLAKKYSCPIWMSYEEITSSGYSAPQLVSINNTPFTVGQMHIQPILTPGHTSGSICYLIDDNLFTGDTLFIEGCGICNNTQDAYSMYASLNHLKSILKPETLIFPGHSYGKSPGQMFSLLLKDNIYLQFKNEYDFATYRLRKKQNILKHFNFQ